MSGVRFYIAENNESSAQRHRHTMRVELGELELAVLKPDQLPALSLSGIRCRR